MSIWAVAAGVIAIGSGLGAPELPGLLERAGQGKGLDLTLTAPGTAADGPIVILPPTNARPPEGLWKDLALTAAGEGRLWISEGWAGLPGAKGLPEWRASLEQLTVTTRTEAWTVSPKAKIFPTAQALGAAEDAIASGGLSPMTSVTEFYQRNGQLNDRGLYLVTMVMLASLTGEPPEGTPARLTRLWMSRDSVVTPELAVKLQEIAWQAVREQLPLTAPKTEQPPPPSLPYVGSAPPALQDLRAAQLDPQRPAPPAPVELDPPEITAPNIAFNLAEIADWSVQQPFLDVMKTARPWIAHKPGQWGGFEEPELRAGGYIDANGWPKALPPGATGLTTLVLTDLPAEAEGVAGRYFLRYEGEAKLKLDGRAALTFARPGEVVFDYTPGEGGVVLTISEISATNPIRNLRMAREDRLARLEAGETFNPDWLSRLRGTEMLRFMDWMRTNGATLAQVDDQPRREDASWVGRGAPLSVMIELANLLQADAWFTLPHLAEDALVRDYAQQVHAGLAPGRKAYVEFSNEVWNHIFPQAAWAEAEGMARWGEKWKWVQFYALRAAEVSAIWSEVFADDPSRLVRVLGTQTGWVGLEIDILDAPLVQKEGRPAPYKSFDALAVTGYVAGGIGGDEKFALLRGWLDRSRNAAEDEAKRLGLAPEAAAAHIQAHRFDLAISLALEEMRDGRHSGKPGDSLKALLEELLPSAAKAAKDRGLALIMYEGGTHAVAHGALQNEPEITAFLTALNYAPGMGALYRDLIDGWAALSDAPFNAFVDVMAPSKFGSWGALRHLGDDNPRWRALAKGEGE